MAARHSLHSSNTRESVLDTRGFGREHKTLPILPYERQLIAALGCSEEEYRHYRRELINKNRRRPAGYEHIPDIVADPITIAVVSLVVGAVMTGVSMLLAPKPKMPNMDERANKKLASQQGRTRFNSSSNFDGLQGLGELGAPLPIIFGKYSLFDDHLPTGGISATPTLLWSRMFSYGSHQGFKALYMLGEEIADTDENKPEAVGVQIGTTPMDGLAEAQQAFYWKPEGGRMAPGDLLWGTRAQPAAGDPQTNDDIYACPIFNDPDGPGFCQALNPPTSSQFGVFSPVMNGTSWRTNWRVISIPSISGPDDPEDRLKMESRKIAGEDSDSNGMKGLGRGYGIYMGINGHNGSYPEEPQYKVESSIGDTINFVIRGKELSDGDANFVESSGVTADDINHSLNSLRSNADDILQVGELYMIGRSIWQVTGRSGGDGGVWIEGKADVNVTLKCIEQTSPFGGTTIGIAGRVATEAGITEEGGEDFDPARGWVGPSFWPLCKVALGVYRNIRPTDCTEFGIRSNVWNQANGLCNFNSVPTPDTLKKYDEKKVTLQSGSMSRYFARTSFFTIWLRPAGLQNDGKPYEWSWLGEQFCVTGSQPIDQYNYIRVICNSGEPKQMEYRFIPKTNSDLRFHSSSESEYWRLNVRTGNTLSKSMNTEYGSFTVTTVGDIVREENVRDNPEMYSAGKAEAAYTECVPTNLTHIKWLPDNITIARGAAFCFERFGDPDNQRGFTKSDTFTYSESNGRELEIKVTATCVKVDWDDYIDRFNTEWAWSITTWGEVTGHEGDWEQGEKIEYMEQCSSNNYFASHAGLTQVGAKYQVTVTCEEIIERGSIQRVFESRSQISEISHYDEMVKSCEQGPEHQLVYVNESVTNTYGAPGYYMSTMGVAVRSSTALRSVDQLRAWIPNGVDVKRWGEGDPPGTDPFGPSNLFCDLVYALLTNERFGVGGLGTSQWIDGNTLRKTAKFLKANRIFYDGVIQERVNLRTYLSGLAPMMLCNFVIAGGQFSVTPALPTDDNGNIDPSNVPISAIFTEGNIVDGSYELDYLEAAEREDFRAVMVYRVCEKNKLPNSETLLLRWAGTETEKAPTETFDMTDYCTSKTQALMVGRYLLSIRRRVDHVIQFQTSPVGLKLAPGNFIKVVTQTAPVSAALNAVISIDNGAILAMDPLANGTYEVSAYRVGGQAVEELTITVEDNRVTDESLWGTIFSTITPDVEGHTYLVEEISVGEDVLCTITASHFPMKDGQSVIATDVLSPDLFFPDTTTS